MTASDWENPVVRDGMARMLDNRARLIERGEVMIGWKLAFGAPIWLEKFGTSGPLPGFLPGSRKRRLGALVSVEGWTRPVAEPEMAVYLQDDVDDPDRVADSISAIGPAIELADVVEPPEDLAEVLAGNIFHKAVILGEADLARAGGDISGVEARVSRDGEMVAATSDPQALIGELVPILTHTAKLLEAFGEKLRAGEVVITGSVFAPLQLSPGEEIGFRLDPIGTVVVHV
jgi:2-keto-4-pentenoate hydratase